MSTISAASSASINFAQNSNLLQTRQAFSQMSSAIQSGDLPTAQSAYDTLTQNTSSNPSDPLARALQQIGSALQSGDTDQAQQALSQLQQQMQGGRAHHHGGHHKAGGADQAQSNPIQTTAATATTTPAPSTSTSTNLIDKIV
jgi:thioredoxin-like negative regulator of GroEL